MLRIGDRLRADGGETTLRVNADRLLTCGVHVQEHNIVAQTSQSKQGRLVNQVADDAGAVAPALDRWIDGQQGDVGMWFAAGVFAAFAAHVECSETDQAAIRIAVGPYAAIAELHTLRDILLHQTLDEWIRERPTGDGLKLATIESDQNRGERDGWAVCHAPLASQGTGEGEISLSWITQLFEKRSPARIGRLPIGR